MDRKGMVTWIWHTWEWSWERRKRRGNWLGIPPSFSHPRNSLPPLPFTLSLAQKSIRFDESSHLLHFGPIGKQIRLVMDGTKVSSYVRVDRFLHLSEDRAVMSFSRWPWLIIQGWFNPPSFQIKSARASWADDWMSSHVGHSHFRS